jgi:hypothetical protein
MCLDKGTQTIMEAYADAEFPFYHENSSNNIAVLWIRLKTHQ